MQLVIDLPPRAELLAFHRKRWEEVCRDPQWARWNGKVETNAHGNILMSPPSSGIHSSRQGEIVFLLRTLLQGRALPECPVTTLDGIRSADVGWYSDARFAQVDGQLAFEIAPEICVEVRSPSNRDSEMKEKRMLYFEAGAKEVWICEVDGAMRFYHADSTDSACGTSTLCPDFPLRIR
jgi:Uma2 family endonuclease